jgi:Mn-dependent DtxR family transcriptional regulator
MLEEKKALLDISSVASQMKVSMPAASQMATELKALGYIEKEPYGDIVLTPEGRTLANQVYHRHKVLCRYLVSIGVSPDIAEEDCCRIEHVISPETFSAIERQLVDKN